MSRVTLDGMEKSYNGTQAVSGMDLEIAEGEFLVLLGPSGCGKTTTLRCIAGLEDITGGRILIDGKPVSTAGKTTPPEQRTMGMVFQSYAVWPHMTVADNLAFGLRLRNLSRPSIDKAVLEALDMVGLADYAKRGMHELSGGQQQRVAVARAVVLRPKVLLFDEPLSNLDAQLREHMRFELRQLQQQLGITAIYVTHDQQEAMVVADRVVLMNKGRIEQIGTPQEIYRRPATLFSAGFIGLANTLAGTVIEASESTTVKLANGTFFVACQSGFDIGEQVRLIVRPEEIRVGLEEIDGPNQYRGIVISCQFLGNIADMTVRIGATLYRVQISPARDWAVGSEVTLTIDPDGVTMIPVL
jgi:iron(III) transport system ATP-binding protein/putative spermidine/putrescine transport system ATP-binding protein